MKFAIYGDSYVDGRANKDHNAATWASKLARSLGAETIDYYVRAGSPLYWSYQNIINTGHNYDGHILAVTEPMRFPVAVGDQQLFVTGYDYCDTLRNPLRDHLRGWFAVSDISYLNTVQELMLADLERRHPNIIMVPCFKTSFSGARLSEYGPFALYQLNELMIRQLGADVANRAWQQNWAEYQDQDHLLCHLPWEWHDIIALKILRSRQSGTRLLAGDLWPLKLRNNNLDHYYLRR